MGTTPTGNAGTLDMQAWVSSQSVEGNYSVVSWQLVLSSSYRNTYQNSAKAWSTNVHGNAYSGTFTFNFNNYTSLVIASGSTVIYHNPDGTAGGVVISGSIAATGTSSIGGPATDSDTYTFPTIPRASTATLTVNPVDAGSSTTINTNRASSGFTHTLEYYFGSASGQIATGVTDSYAWTIPVTLLQQIPNATSGVGVVRTHTYSGATYVGYKDTSITINAGASAVPSFTTITHSEATTSPDVATLIGAYVASWTKLNVAITGTTTYQGASITSYKIEVAGQTINAVSGQTAVLGQSGALTLKGTITDSRGRSATKSVSINVLSYSVPAITSSSAQRSTVGGVIDPNGTYFKVNVVAVTQSLVVGTQKNNLTYVIRVRASNNATAWSSITPAKSGTTAATGYNEDSILGTYSVASSYTVRIEITDKLGALAAQEIQVSTGGTLIHLSKTYDGFGVGKYWEKGSIDAAADIYTKGNKVGGFQSDPDYAKYNPATPPSSFPMGYHTTLVDPQSGWPVSSLYGNLRTIRPYAGDQGATIQYWTSYQSANDTVYYRQWFYQSSAWSAWQSLTSTADVNALADARVLVTKPFINGHIQTITRNSLTTFISSNNLGGFSSMSSTSVITIPKDGIYQINISLLVAASAATYFILLVNGTADYHAYTPGGAGGLMLDMRINVLRKLTAGTQLTHRIDSSDTSISAWTGATAHNDFSIAWVGGIS